jgi:hypothetical protein
VIDSLIMIGWVVGGRGSFALLARVDKPKHVVGHENEANNNATAAAVAHRK